MQQEPLYQTYINLLYDVRSEATVCRSTRSWSEMKQLYYMHARDAAEAVSWRQGGVAWIMQADGDAAAELRGSADSKQM